MFFAPTKAKSSSKKQNKKDKSNESDATTSKTTKTNKKATKEVEEVVIEEVSSEESEDETKQVPTKVEANKNNDEESESEEEDIYSLMSCYEPVFWNGNIPKPTSIVAAEAAKTKPDTQVQQCEEIIELINDKSAPTLETLSQATSIIPFLVPIPGREHTCKIIYGLGSGNGITGLIANDLGDDILVLHGEISPLVAIPITFQFPEEALFPQATKVPSMAQLQLQRKKKNESAFWFKHKQIEKTAFLPSIIPIPAFLVYDGFDEDLDPIVILERWLNLRESLKGVYRTFNALLSCFARAQTVHPTKPYLQGNLDHCHFTSSTPSLVQVWKQKRLKQLFPAHFNPSQPQPTSTTNASESNRNAEDKSAQSYMEELAKTIVKLSNQAPPASQAILAPPPLNQAPATSQQPATTTTSNENNNNLGLSASGHACLLTQCGLVAGKEDAIPVLWKLLAEKNASLADKKAAVKHQLSQPNNQIYREARLRLLASVITMIIKRDFKEELGLSSLVSAAKGLTPYCVPDITESDLERINEQTQALDLATTTTVKDVTACCRVAKTPHPSKHYYNNSNDTPSFSSHYLVKSHHF